MTTELLNFVNATKGISKSWPKKSDKDGTVRKAYPTVSKSPSRKGAKAEASRVMRRYIGLLILIKRMKIKSRYKKTLFLGMSPRRIPHEKACAISPGLTFAFRALNNFAIALIIFLLYHTKSLW